MYMPLQVFSIALFSSCLDCDPLQLFLSSSAKIGIFPVLALSPDVVALYPYFVRVRDLQG